MIREGFKCTSCSAENAIACISSRKAADFHALLNMLQILTDGSVRDFFQFKDLQIPSRLSLTASVFFYPCVMLPMNFLCVNGERQIEGLKGSSL